MKSIGLKICVLVGTLFSWVHAQSPNALGSRNVLDYFQDVESKSYYQQERIRSMKGEMNLYSERLHTLQEKFHKIFYGKQDEEVHQSPFGKEERMGYPKRSYRKPMPEVEPIPSRSRTEDKFKSDPNQLAFTVKDRIPQSSKNVSPASSSTFQDPEYKKVPTPKEIIHRKAYFILRPGFTFSPKSRTTNYPGQAGKKKVREYQNGFSLLASGGFKFDNGIKLGGGAFHRRTEHDTGKSYQAFPGSINYYPDGSESLSWGGFVEIGYEYSLNKNLGFYGDFGLGYGLSITDKTIGQDLEDFIFLTTGLGISWTPADFFALSLGYRYLHEREVPAHAIEIGLEGKF